MIIRMTKVPVIERTTPPKDIQPSLPVSFRKYNMYIGERARNMFGFHLKMLYVPMPLMQSNQAVIIGANRKATLFVP